ncbi:MAG TPA: alpha/beta hydrolase [Pirellulales bacterium]|nr:alpha/beta hydrolase [Pirellulales bacterium]
MCLFLVAETARADEPAVEVIASVAYAEVDEEKLLADVYMPTGEGPYPGVLLVHGGAWLAGGKGRMRRIGTALAERGYVAVSVNYRLAPKHKFPAQLDDCRTAVSWMRDHAADYKIDPARIGGFGYSAGAQLVTLLAFRAASGAKDEQADRAAWEKCRLQVVVAGGTPCDFRKLPPDSRYLAFWLGGTRREQEDLYRSASPMAFVSTASPPVFLYHGDEDQLVLPHGAKALRQALDDVGVEAELVTVAEAGHIATFMDAQALSAAYAFLDRHLHPPTIGSQTTASPEVPYKVNVGPSSPSTASND